MSHAHHEQVDPTGEHITPVRIYLAVYAALLVLTFLTWAVSAADLGPISIYIAMAIAVVKATTVALIFMHLKYDDKLNGFALACSVVFLCLFFGFTMLDVTTRGLVRPEMGNFVMKPELAVKDAEARAQYHAEEHATAAGVETHGPETAPVPPAEPATEH